MAIDIDRLTEAELIDLNHRIVERLRLLQHMRAHVHMLEFRIGERVTFQPDGRKPVKGMLVRYNRKSVTVVTDDGRRWNVSPSLLSRAAPPDTSAPILSLFPGDHEYPPGRAEGSRDVDRGASGSPRGGPEGDGIDLCGRGDGAVAGASGPTAQ